MLAIAICAAVILLVIIGISIYLLRGGSAPKPAVAQKQATVPIANSGSYVVYDGDTPIDDVGDTPIEDFGMYEGALPSWLAHHASTDNFTRRSRQQIHNVNSVNNAVSLGTDAEIQSKHIPVVNAESKNHIRP